MRNDAAYSPAATSPVPTPTSRRPMWKSSPKVASVAAMDTARPAPKVTPATLKTAATSAGYAGG
jgi:hypothetical protein